MKVKCLCFIVALVLYLALAGVVSLNGETVQLMAVIGSLMGALAGSMAGRLEL